MTQTKLPRVFIEKRVLHGTSKVRYQVVTEEYIGGADDTFRSVVSKHRTLKRAERSLAKYHRRPYWSKWEDVE